MKGFKDFVLQGQRRRAGSRRRHRDRVRQGRQGHGEDHHGDRRQDRRDSRTSPTGSRAASPIGAFLTVLIAFLILAAVVYFFVVKPYTAAKARFFPDEPDAETVDPNTELLKEIRDSLRARPVSDRAPTHPGHRPPPPRGGSQHRWVPPRVTSQDQWGGRFSRSHRAAASSSPGSPQPSSVSSLVCSTFGRVCRPPTSGSRAASSGPPSHAPRPPPPRRAPRRRPPVGSAGVRPRARNAQPTPAPPARHPTPVSGDWR